MVNAAVSPTTKSSYCWNIPNHVISYPQCKAREATTRGEAEVEASKALREQLDRCLRRLSDVEKESADKLRYL